MMHGSKSFRFIVLLSVVLWLQHGAFGEPATPPTPKATVAWSVDNPLSPWNLERNRWAEFTVTVAENSEIPKVRLTRSTISDSDPNRGQAVSLQYFAICTAPVAASCPKQPVPLSGRKTTLWLHVDEAFRVNGTFTGALTVDTEPLSDSKTMSLTIQRTSLSARVWGGIVILIGVIIAWLLTIFGRTRVLRDQALLPALYLRDTVSELKKRSVDAYAKQVADFLPTVKRELDAVINDLESQNLDARSFLPASWPGMSQPPQAGLYQAFLQTESQKTEGLSIIVNEGIDSILPLVPNPLPASLPASMQQLLSDLDHLAQNLPQPAQALRDKLAAAIANYNAIPHAQRLGPIAGIAAASPVTTTSYSVRLELQAITAIFWIVWGVLSTGIGIVVLILPSPGFGTAIDYARCALWGFGLPVAGQAIQQLNIATLNTQLGVTVPRL